MPEVARISGPDLKRLLDAGGPLLVLDVREDHERAVCALPIPPTARDLHIPMGQVPGALDALREAAGDAPTVVYCHHGVRSMVVARWLATRGVGGVHNLEGGIDAWSAEVDPALPRY